MSTMTALKQEILAYLEGLSGPLHTARITAEYPDALRACPLKKPVVAVGLESVELTEGGFGGYYGKDPQSADLFGRAALVTVRLDILCPTAQGGEGCHRLYEALCDALLLSRTSFGFYRLRCEDIRHDRDCMANHLRVLGSLRGAVTKGDDSLAVREFDLRRRESEKE